MTKQCMAIVTLAALLVLSLAGCGTTAPETLLAGKWNGSLGTLEFQALEFMPDAADSLKGTVRLSLQPGLFSGEYEIIPAETKDGDNRITITYTPGVITVTRTYLFTVDETTLTIQKENSSVALVYTRGQGEEADDESTQATEAAWAEEALADLADAALAEATAADEATEDAAPETSEADAAETAEETTGEAVEESVTG